MKKLYQRSCKGTVHPSPPLLSDHLSFLPATILTLAAALSPQDQEVLAYLISCSSSPSNFSGHRSKTTAAGGKSACDHPASFNCNCFRCYTTYWVRWDSSPNRHLIHQVIDALEEDGSSDRRRITTKDKKNKKEQRRKKGGFNGSGEIKGSSDLNLGKDEFPGSDSVQDITTTTNGGGDKEEAEEGIEKGSVRKLVSFIGEKIWGVWTT